MSAAVDLRFMNLQTLQQLGTMLRRRPDAALVAVVLAPLDDRQLEAHAIGIGDERDCVAAACHLLAQAIALIEQRGTADPHAAFLPRIAGAIALLGGDTHPREIAA